MKVKEFYEKSQLIESENGVNTYRCYFDDLEKTPEIEELEFSPTHQTFEDGWVCSDYALISYYGYYFEFQLEKCCQFYVQRAQDAQWEAQKGLNPVGNADEPSKSKLIELGYDDTCFFILDPNKLTMLEKNLAIMSDETKLNYPVDLSRNIDKDLDFDVMLYGKKAELV